MREVERSELTSAKFESFVRQVRPHSERIPNLTVVGADTATTVKMLRTLFRERMSQNNAGQNA